MNRKIFFSLIIVVLLSGVVKATVTIADIDLKDTFPIDSSKIIVGDCIICDSEFNLPGMDGKKPTEQELINAKLIYLDARKHKVPLEEQAERHEAKIIEMYKISQDQVSSIYNKSGLTREEGFERLCEMAANSIMPEIKIKQRLFIPHDAIVKYDEENPCYKQAKYEIEIAFMPFLGADAQKQENQLAFLNEQIQNNSLDIMWAEPFWIKDNEIENSKRFITQLKVGQIASPYKSSEGFELYRLKSKKEGRRVPLEKRIRLITDKLREPQMVTMYEDYISALKKDTFILKRDASAS